MGAACQRIAGHCGSVHVVRLGPNPYAECVRHWHRTSRVALACSDERLDRLTRRDLLGGVEGLSAGQRHLRRRRLKYRYVCGYGAADERRGASFTVMLRPYDKDHPEIVVYESPELVDYPYDASAGGCPTCYSPFVMATANFSSDVKPGVKYSLMFLFNNNQRNVQLDTPFEFALGWESSSDLVV